MVSEFFPHKMLLLESLAKKKYVEISKALIVLEISTYFFLPVTLLCYTRFIPLFLSAEKVRVAVVPSTSNVRTVRGAGPHTKNQCAGVH